MIVVVFSKKDIASMTMKQVLLSLYNPTKLTSTFDGNPVLELEGAHLITIENDLIFADYLDTYSPDVDLYIFASRHSSASKTPALLVHTPGNWTKKATLGGNSEEIAISNAPAVKFSLITLVKYHEELNLEDYLVSMEVTHHGPTTLTHPVMFIELGSVEENWKDAHAAEAVVHTIVELIRNYSKIKNKYIPVSGYGGTHYCPRFNQIQLETKYAVGHVIPKYAFEEGVNEKMILEAIKKTYPQPDLVIIDWKGITKTHKDFLIDVLERNNIPYEKARKILKNS